MGQLISRYHQIALFFSLLLASEKVRIQSYNSISAMKEKEVSVLDRF